MKKDFVSLTDFTKHEIEAILALAEEVKTYPDKFNDTLLKKSLGLLFEKPSTRTRVSFEVGIFKLGGKSFYLSSSEVGMGVREDLRDVARTLSRYLDGLVLRTFKHETIVNFAKYANVPVVNGLSDLLHPCQALSDIFTMREKRRHLDKAKITYIGDGNNVLHSLLFAVAKLGLNIIVSSPKGYEPKPEILEKAKSLASTSGATIEFIQDPKIAVEDADFIYTDVWTSMGQEAEKEKRIRDFEGYQLNQELLSCAKDYCYVMHCLPAHRNEEITEEVIESEHSIVFDQAENRLHTQKAILLYLLKSK